MSLTACLTDNAKIYRKVQAPNILYNRNRGKKPAEKHHLLLGCRNDAKVCEKFVSLSFSFCQLQHIKKCSSYRARRTQVFASFGIEITFKDGTSTSLKRNTHYHFKAEFGKQKRLINFAFLKHK